VNRVVPVASIVIYKKTNKQTNKKQNKTETSFLNHNNTMFLYFHRFAREFTFIFLILFNTDNFTMSVEISVFSLVKRCY